MITPVILAGGSGTRLWPLSRAAFPKQFLALTSTQTMLQETVARLNGLSIDGDSYGDLNGELGSDLGHCASVVSPLVICNEEHRFLVAEQMRQYDLDQGSRTQILLEPVGRNTAPAIALAAIKAHKENSDAILLVLAADHVIENVNVFQQCINDLLPAVKAGKFGTLGIVPTQASTGYGYIQC
jgi:mannose-1-phosphate guanylyltransferase